MRLLTISAAVLALLSVAFLPFEASAIKLKSLTMHDAKGLKRRPLQSLSQVFQEGEDHFRSEWERALSDFDKNGDGKISLDEVLEAYSGYIGVRVEDLPEDIRRYIEDDFHKIDANGDGTVDFEEALQAFGPHNNQLVQVFLNAVAPPRPENGTQPARNNTQRPRNNTQPPRNNTQQDKPSRNDTQPPKPQNDTKPPKRQNDTQGPNNNTQQPPKPDNSTKPPKNDSRDAKIKREWDQALEIIDVNHDGKVSRQEAYELVALAVGVKSADLSKEDRKQIDYAFDLIDTNGDGYVSFDEFRKVYN